MNRVIIVELITYLLAFLFTYAAISKLQDLQLFRAQMGQSPMLTAYKGILGWAVPTTELLIVTLLFIPRLRLLALYASLSLMTLFTTYIYVITHYSQYIPCSCGGILQHLSWHQHFLFNIFFILLNLSAIGLYERPQHKLNLLEIQSGDAENL